MTEIAVRIPATTANLGPGFDCLGIALGLANTVRVKRANAWSSLSLCYVRAGNIAEAEAAGAKARILGWGGKIKK